MLTDNQCDGPPQDSNLQPDRYERSILVGRALEEKKRPTVWEQRLTAEANFPTDKKISKTKSVR